MFWAGGSMDATTNVKLLSGREMPVLGLGTWGLTHNTVDSVLHALRTGYRMIDTSGDYGTQPAIGESIKQSGLQRDKFYIVTKVEEVGDAYQTTLKNLNELQLNYIDLTLIHRPPKTGVGEELWRDLIRAKNEGLTKDIGVSNYNEEQIEELIEATQVPPAVNQIEWSPFGHSPDMLAFCQNNQIIIQAYSPLTRSRRLDDLRLEDIAEKYEKTTAQILIRWNLQLGVVPIIKANQYFHQEENLDVFDFELNEDDMEALNSFNEHYSSLGTLAYV